VLQEAEIPFLVGGAFALHAYTGVVRDTKDFDLMVRPEDVRQVVEVFGRQGWEAEVTFAHWLAKVRRGEVFIDIIFSSGNGLCRVDEAWFEHGQPAAVFGVEVKLCPPEEMIWQKCYIMERERFDGADVAHMVRSLGMQLDWPRLVARFGPDWKVLFAHLVIFSFIYPSKTDLLPVGLMQEFVRKFLLSLGEEGEGRVCNGTFLSRSQYLPDVTLWGFADPRLAERCGMTAEQVAAWTQPALADPTSLSQ